MQLTIFDVDSQPFNFGDAVQVINATDDMEAETFLYLQDLQNKKGLIMKVINRPSLQYEVDFNGKSAMVYHHELEGLT